MLAAFRGVPEAFPVTLQPWHWAREADWSSPWQAYRVPWTKTQAGCGALLERNTQASSPSGTPRACRITVRVMIFAWHFETRTAAARFLRAGCGESGGRTQGPHLETAGLLELVGTPPGRKPPSGAKSGCQRKAGLEPWEAINQS